jgi:hypothetical protein
VFNNPASNSGGSRFKSVSGDKKFCPTFYVEFPRPINSDTGIVGAPSTRPRPHPFQPIIHYHTVIQRYVIWVFESVINGLKRNGCWMCLPEYTDVFYTYMIFWMKGSNFCMLYQSDGIYNGEAWRFLRGRNSISKYYSGEICYSNYSKKGK